MFGNKKEETPSVPEKTKVTLEHILEALLFYTAKELSFKELSSLSGRAVSDVKQALITLQNTYANRGITLIVNKQKAFLVTSEKVAGIIAKLHSDEAEKPLSKAALETLSVVAYHGPVTRMEIDYIRGVNSTYSLRNLMVRGLIDKVKDGATVRYTASTDTYRFMGVSSQQELPDFAVVRAKVQDILNKKEEDETNDVESKSDETREAQEDLGETTN